MSDGWPSSLRRGLRLITSLGSRRHGRLKVQELRCTLGDVIDLSGGGMRIKTRMPPPLNQRMALTLDTPHGPLRLICVAKWIKRAGLFGGRIVGIEFTDLDETRRRALANTARVAAARGALPPSRRAA